jgi:BON domain
MNKALWLVGGLGLGTGLMYLLDPERGSRRRTLARRQVETYRRQANTLLDQTRRTLGDQTRTLGQQARGLLTQARTPLRDARGRGEMWRERAEQMGGTQGLLLLGCVGFGVGLMYLFDPNIGRRRRALIRDKTRAYWHKTGTFIGQTARDARNRTRGLVAEARTSFRSTASPDDTVLEARVRAQLGHAISHGGAIRVTAHEGRVTLSGPISPSAADKLLTTVASVAGVSEVVNHLEVRPEYISGVHDGNPAR